MSAAQIPLVRLTCDGRPVSPSRPVSHKASTQDTHLAARSRCVSPNEPRIAAIFFPTPHPLRNHLLPCILGAGPHRSDTCRAEEAVCTATDLSPPLRRSAVRAASLGSGTWRTGPCTTANVTGKGCEGRRARWNCSRSPWSFSGPGDARLHRSNHINSVRKSDTSEARRVFPQVAQSTGPAIFKSHTQRRVEPPPHRTRLFPVCASPPPFVAGSDVLDLPQGARAAASWTHGARSIKVAQICPPPIPELHERRLRCADPVRPGARAA
ncbi:hypothetical protein B0H15DRAFT_582128 [Mycena belliarum]|uniref:Uncharacterized protein n=1 Tax=Mycena belliarum TaxID=1033014 RepID=A0AAD6XVC2_9AGAR|nr:hypothetical protein B0H15DRAFT_582128 [Mycena belliae]